MRKGRQRAESQKRDGQLEARPYIEAFYPLISLGLVGLAFTIYNYFFFHCEFSLNLGLITLDLGRFSGCSPLDITTFVNDEHLNVVTRGVKAFSGRAVWVFLTALNHIVCLAAAPVAYYLIRESLEDYSESPANYVKPRRRALIILGVFLALSVSGGYAQTTDLTEDYQPLLTQALSLTAKADVRGVVDVARWTVGGSYAASALLALSSCVILWPPSGGRAATALELANRMRLLRGLLYFGMILLVIVSLRFGAELRWAAELMKAEYPGKAEVIKVVENLFSVVTSTQAGVNTMILASIYLPAAFVLRRRASALAEGNEKTLPGRTKWLQEQGLAFSFSEHLPRVAAMLAPLLAGPIGELVGKLTK